MVALVTTMKSIEFRSIRPIRGSANNGFEELCCQLAASEDVPAGSRFIRNGTPDGGVEGYLTCPDNSEHGWQAKYFFEIGNSQWQQLDDSVQTVLEKHPALHRYTVCLPIDLPDARIGGQQSLRQKWDARVEKWAEWTADRNMYVEFDFWGQSQLLTRLALERHAGRCWFWFHAIELSPAWFCRHLEEVIAAAGPRYTPQVNVELPIARRTRSQPPIGTECPPPQGPSAGESKGPSLDFEKSSFLIVAASTSVAASHFLIKRY
jgi:hypothetical protein